LYLVGKNGFRAPTPGEKTKIKGKARMAKFLNTSATNYFLEELIKTAKDRRIFICYLSKLS
jgi:hypothetical protein